MKLKNLLPLLLLLFALPVRAQGLTARVNAAGATVPCGVTTQASTDHNNSDWVFATPCTTGSNPSGYSVASISYWVGTPTPTTFDVGIYSDANNPTTLLCHTGAQSVSPLAGWNTLTISPCPNLAPNTVYWIGYITGSSTIQQGAVTGTCQPSGKATVFISTQTGSNTLPATFGSAITATTNCYSINLNLTPLGSSGPSHSVTLAWTQSTVPTGSCPVTANTVYRGTTSGAESVLSVISGGGVTFIDTTVVNGATYFYQITASNCAGESGRSTEVSVLIPTGSFLPNAVTLSGKAN